MAQVTVSFEAYRDRQLPAVCVVSGRPADAFVVMRTHSHRRSGAVGALSGLIDAIDVRRPRDVLVGRVPVDAAEWRRLETARRLWRGLAATGMVLLVLAAWTGTAWSGPAAAASAGLSVVAWWRLRVLRLNLPRPVLTHDATLVTIDNVHEAFVVAAGTVAGPESSGG